MQLLRVVDLLLVLGVVVVVGYISSFTSTTILANALIVPNPIGNDQQTRLNKFKFQTKYRSNNGITKQVINHRTQSFGRQQQQQETRQQSTLLMTKDENNDGNNKDEFKTTPPSWLLPVTENWKRSIIFSCLMAFCGASLGPFLDSYHSAFGVLRYDEPISKVLWGNDEFPALTTAWWVPELFALAGFLIGWLYMILDAVIGIPEGSKDPSPPKILVGISLFTCQYWLSGILFQSGVDRGTILNLMSVVAAGGFFVLDGTTSGLITSALTALGGPLIEVGLIWCTSHGILSGGYHYNDLGETGFFPLWIIPVYFLGGPANGNLARGFWNVLTPEKESNEKILEPCPVCNDTRRVPCPSCDGIGTYVAMGGKAVICKSCNGRGYVMCRACFDRYDEDPYDIEAIREVMSSMPD